MAISSQTDASTKADHLKQEAAASPLRLPETSMDAEPPILRNRKFTSPPLQGWCPSTQVPPTSSPAPAYDYTALYQRYFDYYMEEYRVLLSTPLSAEQQRLLRMTGAAGQASFPPLAFGLPPGLEDLFRPLQPPSPTGNAPLSNPSNGMVNNREGKIGDIRYSSYAYQTYRISKKSY